MANFVDTLIQTSNAFGAKCARCLYYGALVSAAIMLVGCGISRQEANIQNKRALASLPYGASKNIVVAHHTGALFYPSTDISIG